MSQRSFPSVALFLAALLVAVFGLTGGLNAGAETAPKAGKAQPAVPNGPKATFALDQFGPSPDDNEALKWSEQTLGMIRASSLPPTVVSRVLAIVQTSVYDAWAAYDPVAVGTQLGGSLRRPAAERSDANKSKAISYAAYRALLNLFPAQEAALTRLMTDLKYVPVSRSENPALPEGVGNLAAKAVLKARESDGSNQYGEKGGPTYSDWTGYRPVNTANELVNQWRWQPLVVNGAPQKFATPHWGRVTPFALTSPGQFAVPGPDLRKDYRKAVQDVVKFSAHLTDSDKVVAEYWADGPRTELPPGHNAIFAAALCRMTPRNDIDNDVKLLFLQANAAFDAGIAVWHYKVKYDFVRPITLVRALNKGKRIKAWGGPSRGGTVTMLGEHWMPYQPDNFVTPPFAEYVSGHSTFTAASFEVLRRFTGSDRLNLSVTVEQGSSLIEPGRVPAADVTLHWRTMQDAANEAGLSREYGGIHFAEGNLHGRTLGAQIGRNVLGKARTYFDGTAGK